MPLELTVADLENIISNNNEPVNNPVGDNNNKNITIAQQEYIDLVIAKKELNNKRSVWLKIINFLYFIIQVIVTIIVIAIVGLITLSLAYFAFVYAPEQQEIFFNSL